MNKDRLDYTVAIDFGSTNSAAYVCKNGMPTALANNDNTGEYQFPSFVEYTKAGVVVGLTAKKNFGRDGKFVIACVKRLLGKTYREYMEIPDKSIFGCEIVESPEGLPEFLVSDERENIRKSCIEVASEIIKSIKVNATNFLDHECKYAYLTYPVDYTKQQQEAIKQACNLAGLEVVGWIREPEAAAMSWCLRPGFQSKEFEKYVIFDFGGGTLDVSCLFCHDGQTTFSHNSGNSMLGGNDVDSSLVISLQEMYNNSKKCDMIPNTLSEKRRLKLIQKLRTVCEDLKRSLSTEISVVADLSDIVRGDDEDSKELPVSRNTFESSIDNIFKKCLEVVDRVTLKEGWAPGTIRHVILVGGSSRICKIRNLLQDKFVNAQIPDIDVVNPYSCVAEGACRKMINDVLHIANTFASLESSYGISGGNDVMILLRKGIPTPCDSAKIFVKVVDTSDKKLVTTVYEYNGAVDPNQVNLLIPIGECYKKERVEFDISDTNSTIFELCMHLEHGGSMRITCWDYYDKKEIGVHDLMV